MEQRTFPLPACVITQRPKNVFPPELENRYFFFMHDVLVFDLCEMLDLELQTTSQSRCDLWKKERRYRVTASVFYDVCVRRQDFWVLAERIYAKTNEDLTKVPAVVFGIEHEGYVRNLIRARYSNFILRKVGLVTNPFFPYLGASPDGLLHNSENTFLLEIKCKFNPSKLGLEDLANCSSDFCLDKGSEGEWKLRRNHRYYYQIQGQLALSNLKQCIFALFYKLPDFVHVEIIDFDDEFWSFMSIKLCDFYFNYYLPVIFNKCN